jgi:hypothetical protein
MCGQRMLEKAEQAEHTSYLCRLECEGAPGRMRIPVHSPCARITTNVAGELIYVPPQILTAHAFQQETDELLHKI